MKENYQIDLAELGARVKQARIERNMSQGELAEASNICVTYISDIERGKKCFSVDKLVRIAQVLQVSTDWLLRLDIPQTEYTYNAEAADILIDCTTEESVILLEVMQATKQSLRKVRKAKSWIQDR